MTEVLGDDVHSGTARRLWNYTRGNVLFLRQLIEDEIAANRLVRRADMWVWDGEPTASPRLGALVVATIGRQPDEIVEVLEILAVAERLHLAVLVDLADAGAVNAAETRGLITIEPGPGSPVARLAHPVFGDVTRARAGAARLRNLRGRVAKRLAHEEEDPVGLVAGRPSSPTATSNRTRCCWNPRRRRRRNSATPRSPNDSRGPASTPAVAPPRG